MADPYRTFPPAPVPPIVDQHRRRQPYSGGGDTDGFAGTPQDSRPGYSPAVLPSSVLGIPAQQMTGEVRNALDILLGELTRLREGAERLIVHEDYLDQIGHQCDLASPVLNRRGLARDINRAVARLAQGGISGTLVLLHLDGLEAFRRTQGLAAGRAAQQHAASALAAASRQSDAVANLGGGDFAVFLALTVGDEAETKAGELAAAVNSPPMHWNGQPFAFTVALGLAELSPISDIDSLLAEADARRRPLKSPD